jgi:hypothetical protein
MIIPSFLFIYFFPNFWIILVHHNCTRENGAHHELVGPMPDVKARVGQLPNLCY